MRSLLILLLLCTPNFAQNFADTNLTLNGNRTHDLNDFGIQFLVGDEGILWRFEESTSDWRISSSSFSLLEVTNSGDVTVNASNSSGVEFAVHGDTVSDLVNVNSTDDEVEIKNCSVSLGSSSSITIDGGGTINAERSFHAVAAASGTEDDLDEIDGGSPGAMLILTADTGDLIRVRDEQGGTGDNIDIKGDATLDDDDTLTLILSGSTWIEVTRSID